MVTGLQSTRQFCGGCGEEAVSFVVFGGIADILDDPLSLSRKGGHALKRPQACKIINDAARAVGTKENIGTHTLRKTFGYHAYQSGVSLAVLQKLFNHSAPSVTLSYIGITQNELDGVYLNLNL